ncbi:MAG: glucosamine inositolphosphorylceramide transferase family protein [Janthinobacterium lividum]
MRIAIVVAPHAVRRWHGLIRDRLLAGADVRFRAGRSGPPLPGSVTALLMLERLVIWRGRDALFDPVEISPGSWWSDGDEVDLVLDLDGAEAEASSGTALRPLFDGLPSELALVSALLAGRMPEIAVVNRRDGSALAVGHPSSEYGGGLTGALDSVLSRTVLLIDSLVSAPRRPAPGPPPALRRHGPPRPAAVLATSVAREAARAIYKLCMFTPHWRIGWRRHDGPGVVDRLDLDGPAWRSLPDPGHRFFADPFPVVWNGREVIFVEDLDHRVGKGIISAVELVDGTPRAPVAVLEEPWHLSYPFLIEEAGHLYMLPEASLSDNVTLYRCIDFPLRWERCATLLSGVEAADATIVRHDGRYWMFAVTREGRGGYSDTLRIWHASSLFGPWEEHGLRPVTVDAASARPAGGVVASRGALWRPFQDCAGGYGTALGLARIDRLDPDHFDETVVARLRPGPRWPGRRVHTLARWGPIECIDGSAFMPRLPAMRSLAASWTRLRAASRAG